MIRSRMARLSFAAAVATALPVAGVVSLAAGHAGASTVMKVKCTTLSGNATTTAMLSGCTGGAGTGGATMPTTLPVIEGGGKVIWVSGKKTKLGAPTVGAGTLCPKTDPFDVTVAGAVKKDTTGSITVPGTYKGEICVDANENVSLAPGTKFQIS